MKRILLVVALVLVFPVIVLAQSGSQHFSGYSFLPILDRQFDEEGLSQWIRPIVPVVLDSSNRIIATADIRGIAVVLSREEILVSAGPFLTSPSFKSAAQDHELDLDDLHLGALLIWDILEGGESGIFEGEIIPFVDEDNLGNVSDERMRLVRLSRSPIYSSAFPAPSEFPYPIFDGPLSPLQKVVVVGHWKTDKPELIMTFAAGTVRAVNDEVLVQVSLSPYDWGAPAFVMDESGHFMMAGIVIGGKLRDKRETEAFMLPIKEALR